MKEYVKWIPVTNGLPAEYRYLAVLNKNGNIGVFFRKDNKWMSWDQMVVLGKAVAYIPLPDPEEKDSGDRNVLE